VPSTIVSNPAEDDGYSSLMIKKDPSNKGSSKNVELDKGGKINEKN